MPRPSLYFRRGDVQALKPIIAAASANVPLKTAEISNASPLTFALPDGVTITEPNSMSQALMEVPFDQPTIYCQVLQWMEWEETILRPLIYSSHSHSSELDQALVKLDSKLQSGNGEFLVEGKLTLADIVIFSSLFPNLYTDTLPSGVRSYLDKLSQLPSFQKGIKTMLGGGDRALCRSVTEEYVQRKAAAMPKVPIPGQRNILITSALPYVNNVPHLGNIIGCVLSADCFARFCRARGYNTIYICGTDEYGTATETKAYEEGVSCEEICDKYHAIHKGIYEWFEISCDKFGRTPTRHQTKIAQDIFKVLEKNRRLNENEMQQLYSDALGRFLADRFITGTCPKCGYEDARGDQCDQCGCLLNPTELIDPKCKFTGTTPVMKSTKHIFLDLPGLAGQLELYIEKTSKCGGWSSNCLQITNAWIRDGLKQRCITRDLKWGVPVPLPGYESKVFYVWFDAPIGYISITAEYTAEWEKWWKNPDDVELVQFMGKDNVPFHTIIFPATMIGTGQKWTMMKRISVTEYLNYESGKFSKTRGTGVFGDSARDSGIPVEVWRYYLLSNRPESQDTSFSWDNLGVQNNSELLNNLGNFINRALKFVERFYDSIVPDGTSSGEAECLAFGSELLEKTLAYIEKMEAIQIKAALAIVMDISATGNKFLQDQKPWELFKHDPEKCKTVVRSGIGLVKILAALLQPFMPSISRKILGQMNVDWDSGISLKAEDIKLILNPVSIVPTGHRIHEPTPLFVKITDDQLQSYRDQFKGRQEQRTEATAKKRPRKKEPLTEKSETEKRAPKVESNTSARQRAPIDISRLDIRIGYIQDTMRHAETDTLYVSDVDIGEGPCRTVVSDLVKHVTLEQMQKRFVVVLSNMKPVKMSGVKSEAVILAVVSLDGEKVELLKPPNACKVGERVTVPEYTGEPDSVLNPKTKVLEKVLNELKTNSDRIACYAGKALSCNGDVCTSESISEGFIR